MKILCRDTETPNLIILDILNTQKLKFFRPKKREFNVVDWDPNDPNDVSKGSRINVLKNENFMYGIKTPYFKILGFCLFEGKIEFDVDFIL